MNDTTLESFERLLRNFGTAMLITTSLEGMPRARPMAVAAYEDGMLYFASRAEDEKLEEIANEPRVAVSLQEGDLYLSITGLARRESDAGAAARLWSPSMKLWFPDGPEDRHLALIVVEPQSGEYWDRRGLLRLQFLWEAGKALVQGRELDEGRLRGHAKIEPTDR